MMTKFSRRVLGGLAFLAVLLTATIGNSAAVQAAPRQVALTPVASVNPGDGRDPSLAAVDSENGLAYVVDRTNWTIQVYDVAESTMTLRTQLTNVFRPLSVTLDNASGLLFVTSLNSFYFTSIDADPKSANYGRVIRQYPVGSDIVRLAVDESTSTIFASSPYGKVFVIAEADGSTVTADTGGSPSQIFVDEAAHVAFTTISDGIVATVDAAGSVTKHEIGGRTSRFALSGELLAIVVNRGVDYRIELYSTENWQLVAQSTPLDSPEVALAIDRSLHLLYVAYGSIRKGIDLLQLSTLEPEAFVSTANYLQAVALDPSTHSVFVSDKYNIPAAVTMYRPLLNPSASVRRIGGADRFAVASAIAVDTFARGIDTVYVATGLNFPDALAGAAAAGHSRSPVVLTERDKLPAATRQALSALAPKRIVVVGGQRQYLRTSLTSFVHSARSAVSAGTTDTTSRPPSRRRSSALVPVRCTSRREKSSPTRSQGRLRPAVSARRSFW
ncbi:hypothetical protein HL652_13005 [Herbiconiux sp. SALV-R1]|uniref:cell wall-binding repeat-containing protein n=1 Tax=Herbiconiux sp. SALV-R1 TaxID=2735133 RepID=UPI0014920288|nr:cell wall-binding repeat-containing protein [Herbiconiux sp. SALV-R1]QJU54454.1 hypothetical protein HL652_13005 [Herbiconiux sp. SALV-R1]